MKGVVSNPNKEMNQDFMDDWLDNYVEPIPCNHGDVVEGVITMVSSKSILIDIGGKCDALVQPREVEQMSPEELRTLRPGQVIHVYVIDDAEDKETIIVSLAKAAEYNDWIKARNLMENKKNIVLKVVDVNKGGLIVEFMGLRGFVPGSQLLPNWRVKQDAHSTEHRWDALVGEELTLRIIEVTPEHNRLILSERMAVDGHDKKHSVLADLSSGDEVWGIVSNLVPFGAFVNVKGVDGLVHISELSWHRVNRPSDVLRVGQKVKVYVLDVDLERERLSLSVKRMKTDPWANVDNICKEGQSVEVEIVNMVSFGAFAALVDSPGVEGLIHVSEMSDKPVQRPEDAVRLGEHYMARIISLQQDERRIAFSLKQVGAEVSVKHHESHDVSTA